MLKQTVLKYFKIIGLYVVLCIMGIMVGVVKMTEGTAFGMILFFVAILVFSGQLIGLIHDTFFDWKVKSKIIDNQVRRMQDEQWRQEHSYLFEEPDWVKEQKRKMERMLQEKKQKEPKYFHWCAHRWMPITFDEFCRIQRLWITHKTGEVLLAEHNGISYHIKPNFLP